MGHNHWVVGRDYSPYSFGILIGPLWELWLANCCSTIQKGPKPSKAAVGSFIGFWPLPFKILCDLSVPRPFIYQVIVHWEQLFNAALGQREIDLLIGIAIGIGIADFVIDNQ